MSNHSMLGRGWRGRPRRERRLRGGLGLLTPEQRALARPPRHVEVPPELADPGREREYEFPRVALPEYRPQITAAMLREVLSQDDPQNQALLAAMEAAEAPLLLPGESAPLTGPVMPDAPQPASAPGLEPADGPEVPLYIGTALPSELTAWELDLYAGTAPPPDPWARFAAQLADAFAETAVEFEQLDAWIAGETRFERDRVTRHSEELRKHLVGGDLLHAGDAMADAYEHGGTVELTGLAAKLAAMIAANAQAQPEREFAGVSA